MAQTAPAVNACAPIRFDLANPIAGTRIDPGDYILQGIAMDNRTPSGIGIDQIEFFIENRDTGGQKVGSAVPGAVPGPMGFGSFQSKVTIPKLEGGHTFFAYAHSAVTGQESVLMIPVAIGIDVDDIELDPNTPATRACIGLGPAAARAAGATTTTTTTTTAPATGTGTGMATTPPATTTTTTTAPAGSASNIVMSVGNPQPGDKVLAGAFSVQGDAYDKAATSGTGIDRIDIFLDDRDTGGLFLGQAALTGRFWEAVVNLPQNQTGLHELVFYTHSSVSGATVTTRVSVNISKT
jgi:hypothetical protein